MGPLAIKRFQANIRITPGCWLWLGRTDENGYGRTGSHVHQLAHRFSAALYRTDFNRSYDVLHRCDNPRCVNPDHFFFGTQLDNIKDRVSKGRSAKGEAHGSAVLTEGIVREARLRYANGEKISPLAREYGLSHTCMRKAILGITWSHLT